MNTIADQAAPATATFVPSFPRGLLRNLAVDMALPWIAVQLLTRAWAVPIVSAIAIAALFPAASVAIGGLRRRRLDIIGTVILVTLLGGVVMTLVTQDARFALMRAVPGAALFGLACLASLPARRPLMFFLARQFTAGDDPAKLAAWNTRVESAGFRRAMRVLTAVWGLAFLVKAALWVASALLLTPTAALLSGPAIGLAAFGALMAWTIAYARRRSTAALNRASAAGISARR
jgi:hypothetical protein